MITIIITMTPLDDASIWQNMSHLNRLELMAGTTWRAGPQSRKSSLLGYAHGSAFDVILDFFSKDAW